jgi:hypothetical protein
MSLDVLACGGKSPGVSPRIPILTFGFCSVRFSGPRNNEFAVRAGVFPSIRNRKSRVPSFRLVETRPRTLTPLICLPEDLAHL